DEVPEVDVLVEDTAGPAVGEGADLGARADARIGEDRIGLEERAGADGRVGEDAADVDARAVGDLGPGAAQADARADLDVAADGGDVGVDGDGLGRDDGDAALHPALGDAAAGDRVDPREVDAVVHAGDVVGVRLRRRHVGDGGRARDEVGEVELTLRVLGLQ